MTDIGSMQTTSLADNEPNKGNMETYIPSASRLQEESREMAPALVLSEDDLSLIASGLDLLEHSKSEMAKLARVERRDENLANSLESWAKQTEELKNRVIYHQMTIVEKALAIQKKRTAV